MNNLFDFEAGKLLIPGHLLVLIVFAVIGSYFLIKDEEKKGIKTNDTLNMVLICLISLLIGARIFYVLVYHEYFFVHPQEIFKLWKGGFSLHGGAVASLLAGLIYLRGRKLPVRAYGDGAVSYLFLAVFFARLGCFLRGCCYGKVSSLPWAVRYPKGSYAYVDQLNAGLIQTSAHLSLPVHPTQLYEALIGLGLFIYLRFFLKKISFPGQACLTGAIIFFLAKFVIDFFRAESNPLFSSLTITQFASLLLAILSAFLFAYFWSTQKS